MGMGGFSVPRMSFSDQIRGAKTANEGTSKAKSRHKAVPRRAAIIPPKRPDGPQVPKDVAFVLLFVGWKLGFGRVKDAW